MDFKKYTYPEKLFNWSNKCENQAVMPKQMRFHKYCTFDINVCVSSRKELKKLSGFLVNHIGDWTKKIYKYIYIYKKMERNA